MKEGGIGSFAGAINNLQKQEKQKAERESKKAEEKERKFSSEDLPGNYVEWIAGVREKLESEDSQDLNSLLRVIEHSVSRKEDEGSFQVSRVISKSAILDKLDKFFNGVNQDFDIDNLKNFSWEFLDDPEIPYVNKENVENILSFKLAFDVGARYKVNGEWKNRKFFFTVYYNTTTNNYGNEGLHFLMMGADGDVGKGVKESIDNAKELRRKNLQNPGSYNTTKK